MCMAYTLLLKVFFLLQCNPHIQAAANACQAKRAVQTKVVNFLALDWFEKTKWGRKQIYVADEQNQANYDMLNQ